MNRLPLLVLKESIQARGFGVHLLLDISRDAVVSRQVYAVALTLNRKTLTSSEYVTIENALETYEAFELWGWGPRGESTLRAVLRRCAGVEREARGVWQGSIGEFAARQFPIGTWEWLETLRAYRAISVTYEARRAA